jgi:hypothetical protein
MTASELDELVDALSGVLRDFGRYAFDLSRQDARRTEALFDQWAQHVIAGVEAPGGAGSTAGRRDYPGLRRAFSQHRQSEQSEMTAGAGLVARGRLGLRRRAQSPGGRRRRLTTPR